jgi:glycosyltransferase involved in cell wall biosynthesis
MNNPFLSIITINFNNAEGLQKTMESVFSQSYDNFQFLIIDGASTDGSVAILESNNDRLDYWVSEQDSGVYNAMNKGIMASNGDYLLFLNSGDQLTGPSALSDFIHHEKFGGDIIYGDYMFENGEKVFPDQLTPVYFMRTSLPHQSTFFKKEVFDIMGSYDESYKLGGDRAFYIKSFLSNRFQFVHVNYFLTFFDMEGMSNSQEHSYQKKEEDEQMFKESYGVHYEDCKKQLALEQELKNTQKKTFKGIVKRVGIKIKKIWMHRRW